MPPTNSESFSKIIDTAKFPAYLRTFSDIPSAAEVYAFLMENSPVDKQVVSGLVYEDFMWLAPIVESRQKAISKCLNSRPYDLIIELGSGFSLRWLQLEQIQNFVDTDLPSTIELKKKMIEKKRICLPNSVRLQPLNPFEVDLIQFVKSNFSRAKSIAIVHEGLAQYFDKSELTVLAQKVRQLSKHYKVDWISTDFSTTEQFRVHEVYDPNMKTLNAARRAASGRDLFSNAFLNIAQIEAFFNDLSFETEHLPILQTPETIVSFKKVEMDTRRFLELFQEHLKVWRLRPTTDN